MFLLNYLGGRLLIPLIVIVVFLFSFGLYKCDQHTDLIKKLKQNEKILEDRQELEQLRIKFHTEQQKHIDSLKKQRVKNEKLKDKPNHKELSEYEKEQQREILFKQLQQGFAR